MKFYLVFGPAKTNFCSSVTNLLLRQFNTKRFPFQPTFASIDCIPINKIKTTAVASDNRLRNPRGRSNPIVRWNWWLSRLRKILHNFSLFFTNFSSLWRSILRPINFQSSSRLKIFIFSTFHFFLHTLEKKKKKEFSINFHSFNNKMRRRLKSLWESFLFSREHRIFH